MVMIRSGTVVLLALALVACSTALEPRIQSRPTDAARMHHVTKKVVQNPGQQWVTFQLPGYNQPTGIVNGYDGATWLAISLGCAPTCGGLIARYAMDGSYTSYPMPNNRVPFNIVRGPAGLLWFTEENDDKIGSISSSGAIVEYSLRLSGSAPNSITRGSDGKAWFTEVNANKVGRISSSGVIKEFPVPSQPNAGLFDITNGPDGNVWFTESTTGKIGRITPKGKITEFPIGGKPSWITTGPDHNLWIVDTVNNQIIRATTSGISTKFQIPTAQSGAGNIVVGPDKKMWFGEYSCLADNIASVTTRGVIKEYPFAPNNPCTGSYLYVSKGSDGNLWSTVVGVIDVYLLAQISTDPQTISLMVGQNQNLTVAEPRYHSAFGASSSNDLVATVAANGPNAFIVSAVGTGSCVIVISDNIGNSVPVPVVVN
jgi:virginiamycin B lyase